MKTGTLLLLSITTAWILCTQSSCTSEPKDTIPRDVVMNTTTPKLITLKSGAIVEKYGDSYIYSGDILLTKEQLKRLDETGSIFKDDDFTSPKEGKGVPMFPLTGQLSIKNDLRAVGRNPQQNMFWAMVRYTFSEKLSQHQKDIISSSIATIEKETNARFFNATGLPTKDPNWGFDYPYIEFTPHESLNNSNVGRVGGKQIINISDFYEEVIIHEICHALGMFHEQCRNDRDSYITVHYDNIDPKHHHNFSIENSNYYRIGAFDFESIMLYGSFHAAKDYSKPAMTKKDGSLFWSSNKLSEKDRAFINKFYLPFIAREDVCIELDSVMYDSNNRRMTTEEIEDLQSRLNIGRCYELVKPEHLWMWGNNFW